MYASGMREFVECHAGSFVVAGSIGTPALDSQCLFVMTEASR
jgi:hypothetical protein